MVKLQKLDSMFDIQLFAFDMFLIFSKLLFLYILALLTFLFRRTIDGSSMLPRPTRD
jgi:hypothetical protein